MVVAPVIDYIGPIAILAWQTVTLVKIVFGARAASASVRLFGRTRPFCILMATRTLVATSAGALLLVIAILMTTFLGKGKSTESQCCGGEN